MAYGIRRLSYTFAFLGSIIFVLWAVPRAIKPTQPDENETERDKKWINSSPNFLDRQACRWLGLCGIQHIRWDAPALSHGMGEAVMDELRKLALAWEGGKQFENTWDQEEAWMEADLKRRGGGVVAKLVDKGAVPDFVLDNAPLVHLYSGENFWPSDIAEHVKHMRAESSWDGEIGEKDLALDNLGQLNGENGTVFLTSLDDVESRPDWLHSQVGVPTPFDDDDDDGDDNNNDNNHNGNGGADWGSHDGQRHRAGDGMTWWDADKQHPPHRIAAPKDLGRGLRRRGTVPAQRPIVGSLAEKGKPDASGYSKAPAILVLVDKGAGILDAFWFFFYSYNLGQTVLNIRFGNHVGDWEHCMVRFQNGIPRAMFLSEHAGGKAYTWHAMEKRSQDNGKPARPVIYSAVGSHAMYANPGLHPYVLPFKMLKDITDKGPLWDPALNNYAYWYDYEVDHEESKTASAGKHRKSLQPASSNPDAPTSWFHFDGYWGDDVYPLSDERQWRLFGEYHYITGPLGPKWKFLERRKVCQTEKCTIVDSIEAGKKSAWY